VAVRIEKSSQAGKTTIYLIGHFQSEHLEELKRQFLENGPQFVLDLKEVTQVDVDVVQFLGTCRAAGVRIVHCAPYIREWMSRERRAGTP
jgi:anti-anti-sigma regulatory factor